MKKIIILIGTLIAIASNVVPAFAMNYGNTYPSYLGEMKGCAYIEIDNTDWKGSVIVPSANRTNNTISIGTSGGIWNNNTQSIVGYFVASSNGQKYNLRIQSLSTAEIEVTEGVWEFIGDAEIKNTNVITVDYSGTDLQNDNLYLSTKEKGIAIFIVLDLILDVIMLVRSKND